MWHRKTHLDLGSVLPSTSKQAQPTQKDVRISTEADGLHRVSRVSPTTAVTYNITRGINRINKIGTGSAGYIVYISYDNLPVNFDLQQQ